VTLKEVLESNKIPKVFFDVRNDSDALFAHFQISLQCVVVIQLMEFVTRPYPGRYLRGLPKCIQEQAGLNWTKERQWQMVKHAGVKFFAPEKGGTYEIFNARPFPKALLDYCIQDVMLLPKLLLNYSRKFHKGQALDVGLEVL
jgi:exonuclease 3'-5' domain-containing protein 1